MALNYSPCTMYPMNPSEGELASSMRIADRYFGERYGNSFGKEREMDDLYWFLGRDRGDEGGGSCEPIANDILDLLPSDPFGMNLSATFTAIADWIEDFEIESGLNVYWNRAMSFESENGYMGVGESTNLGWRFDSAGSVDVEFGGGMWTGSVDMEIESVWDVDGLSSFGYEDAPQFMSHQAQESGERPESVPDGDGGAPHEALLLSLGYLELRDLLSVEKVCRSLRSEVQNDSLLWKSIHIDQPLNERITDDDLLKITGRAQGSLQSLSLVRCSKITDDGIRRVLECNPKLTKLSVPGCTRLSIVGIVNNLKAFKSKCTSGIKCLRISGLCDVTQKHFEELRFLLNADKCQQPNARKPRFFHSGHSFPSHDDDCPIDIEMCPRCQNLRLVYDCTLQSCQGKQSTAQQCRACTFCIARCIQCGRCIEDSEYEETFSFEFLCWGCRKLLLQCQ